MKNLIVSMHGNTLIKPIILLPVAIIVMFIITGMITALKPEYRISSSSINQWTSQFDGAAFIQIMGYENAYFSQSIKDKGREPIKFSSIIFELATSINPEDPRSLLGRELPGFSLFDSEIIVAGEGTNYTTMPYESSPPLEVLLKEREASIDSLEQLDKSKPIAQPILTTNGKKVVYLYTTHSRESYLPHLPPGTKDNEAYHSEVNVTKVSEKLGKELEKRGIGVQIELTDFTTTIKEKGIKNTYDASRPAIKNAITTNRDLVYFIDLHRDSQPREITTTKINGDTYARTIFVIGGEHAKYEQNLKLATQFHNLLDEKYPGLSRGIIKKQGIGTNGKFNQDLSENALLIEMGGIDNSLEEVYRTAEAIAEIFSDFYWQAEKVDGKKG